MFGKILVDVALVTSVLSIVFYFLSGKSKGNFALIGRVCYLATALGLIFISAFFLSNILDHNFQYTYIWSYSSRELSDFMLLASFWAGQEGSFLLWSLLLSIVGVFLLPYAKKKGYEAHVMGLYSIIILFLLLILVVKSPFDYVWQSFPDAGLEAGFTPPNGRGMNPVLQNYWITIHPPILFLGYAAMSVPYVFALAGLMKRDYKNWVNVSMPWSLFSVGLLGLGIMLGGFWAYETLGWGGFWGWDPVENSSLIPWIVGVALIHTMLVQKRTGGLIKTNFFLSISVFILVLYATFLTRSGILGDTSVHSFVDPGQIVYNLLLLFMATFVVFGVIVLMLRLKDLPGTKVNFKESSKEFYIAVGSLVLLASSVVVFIGTSFPIMTNIIGMGKITQEVTFYNNWNMPLIIAVLIINALSIYLNWRSNTSFKKVISKSKYSIIASVLATILLVVYGVTDAKFILLGLASFFSLFINLEFIARNIAANPRGLGAHVSHMGISILMLGVLFTGGYSKSTTFSLADGNEHYAYGYTIKYLGKEQIEKNLTDREKFAYNISASKDGSTTTVRPIIYYSSFNNWMSPFFEPGIKTYVTGDLYVSPKSIEDHVFPDSLVFSKGIEAASPYDTAMKITFIGFDMTSMQQQTSSGQMILGGVFKFSKQGVESIDTLYGAINPESGVFSAIWRNLGGKDLRIGFAGIVPNDDMAKTQAILKFSREIFIVDVSVKPFMSLVWLGTIAIVAGFIIAIFRHISNRRTVNKIQGRKTNEEIEEIAVAK